MLSRATDATFINAVVNDPSVRPYVYGPPGPLDLTPIISNPNNFVLTGKHGGMVMIEVMPHVFELHAQVLPDGRGLWAQTMADQSVAWLFMHTRANEIIVRIPVNNVPALMMARACGAIAEHRIEQYLGGPEESEVTLFSGRIQDWIRTAPGLSKEGAEFRERLSQKYAMLGISLQEPKTSLWSDRHLGAAMMMILNGQPIKGVLVYNRWACMAIESPMDILCADPLIVGTKWFKIEVQQGDFEVIPCHKV